MTSQKIAIVISALLEEALMNNVIALKSYAERNYVSHALELFPTLKEIIDNLQGDNCKPIVKQIITELMEMTDDDRLGKTYSIEEIAKMPLPHGDWNITYIRQDDDEIHPIGE